MISRVHLAERHVDVLDIRAVNLAEHTEYPVVEAATALSRHHAARGHIDDRQAVRLTRLAQHYLSLLREEAELHGAPHRDRDRRIADEVQLIKEPHSIGIDHYGLALQPGVLEPSIVSEPRCGAHLPP